MRPWKRPHDWVLVTIQPANASMNLPRKSPRAGICQLPVSVEKLVRPAEVGFRLLHGSARRETPATAADDDLAPNPAKGARRGGNDRTGLFAPDALAIRPRPDIQRILQDRRNRPIIFGRHEQHGIGRTNPVTESDPRRRRICFKILIVVRQIADLDDAQFQGGRRQFHKGVGKLTIDGGFRRLPTSTATL